MAPMRWRSSESYGSGCDMAQRCWGLLFALVWLPVPAFMQRRRNIFLVGVAALTMVSVLLIAWRADWFPAPFALGRYTLAVLAANGVGELGSVAAVFFLRRYLCAAESEDLVFASLTLLFGRAGVRFGVSHVWAADWWVWHGARLLANGILIMTPLTTCSRRARSSGSD